MADHSSVGADSLPAGAAQCLRAAFAAGVGFQLAGTIVLPYVG
jgi:hypothetical protein